jgi:uncharacterized damage-inducible protein DinB
MKHSTIVVGLLILWLVPAVSFAQANPSTEDRAVTELMLGLVANSEKQLTGVAAEMPEGKYDFAPTAGAFRGVRNFAKQIKHAAALQHLVAATILGERITAEMSDERGPDGVRTKADVLQYLKESFAALKRAAATIDGRNAFTPFKGPFGPASDTRVGLMVLAATHTANHYGQVVEYLRMNGIVPPASQ